MIGYNTQYTSSKLTIHNQNKPNTKPPHSNPHNILPFTMPLSPHTNMMSMTALDYQYAHPPHSSISSAGLVPHSQQGPGGGYGQGKLVVRAVVPLGASGTIIGRGGSVIREIGEKCTAKIQLAEIVEHVPTGERILSVTASATTSVVEVCYLLWIPPK